jgi:hypothetical protein
MGCEEERGAARARSAAQTLRKIGARLYEPFAFGVAAECVARAGRHEEALQLMSDAINAAGRNGPGVYDAELHRLHGQLRLSSTSAACATGWRR